MNVLLYSSKGQIGNIFLEIIKKENIEFIEGKARCDNEKELKEEIENINPTHIFFFSSSCFQFSKDFCSSNFCYRKIA